MDKVETSESPSGKKPSLGKKVTKGAFWMVAMRFSIRLIGMVSLIILARILLPSDFGIVAKAVMIHSFLEMFTQFGLDNALIKDEKSSPEHYDTVWTIHILRGVIIAITLIALADPATVWFNEPELDLIIYAYAAVALVNGFINIGIVDFRKNFNFHLDFYLNVLVKVSGFLTTVSIAVTWQSYWAFPAGVFASAVTSLICSYILSKYRPSFTLSEFSYMFHFSKWVMALNLVSAFSNKADTFILSRFSTSENLGLYTITNEVAGLASTEIAMPVARALLPGLSKLRDDRKKFQDLHVQTISLILILAIPISLGLSVLAESFVAVLLGQKWHDAVPVLEILALLGIARVFYAISMPVYVSFNRVDIAAKLSPYFLILRVISLAIGYGYFGFFGMIWGVVISSYIQVAIILIVQRYLGMIVITDLINSSWRIVLASLLMYYILSITQLNYDYDSLSLLIGLSIGIIIYTTSLLALWLISGKPIGPEPIILNFIKSKLKPNLK